MLLIIIGFVGSVLPGLPGSPLILLGVLIYAWYTEFQVITWTLLLGLIALAILSHFLDFFASVLGVKKLGGSRWGMVGALMGGIIGIFAGGIFGLFVGPFLGAFLLELIKTENLRVSLRSGAGTILGFILGTVGKLIIAIIMIGIFLSKLLT
jgi:uncharacterized protein YqgC (DUF456 family)